MLPIFVHTAQHSFSLHCWHWQLNCSVCCVAKALLEQGVQVSEFRFPLAGPAARFFASKGSSAAAVRLQTVGTGMCLHFDEASQLFFGDTNPGDLVVKQISQASTIELSQEVLQQRRRQEANLLVQERRRKAAYALQSSTARETFGHGRAQRGGQ